MKRAPKAIFSVPTTICEPATGIDVREILMGYALIT
jgi:hypothetical protein